MQLMARRSSGLKSKMAIVGGLAASLALAAAAVSTTSPGLASRIANDPETQVAVFLIPVTLLIALMLYEVARFVWRDRIPAVNPPRRRRSHWSATQQER